MGCERKSAGPLLKALKAFAGQTFGLVLERGCSQWSPPVNTGRQDRGPTTTCKKVGGAWVLDDVSELINPGIVLPLGFWDHSR